MPIWKLEPSDKESENWKRSYRKQPIIVRAPSPEEARKLVASKLDRATKHIPGGTTLYYPWLQHDLVDCNLFKDSDYDEKGPNEILDPRELNDI